MFSALSFDELDAYLQFYANFLGQYEFIEEPENVWEVAAEKVELKTDIFGLEREKILTKLEKSVQKSMALRRYNSYSEKQFETAYNESIHR